MSTRQVGAWLYSSSSEHAATNKAARVLGRLLAREQVKKRDKDSETRCDGINFGVAHYVLTPSGAARADDEYCRHGLHLSQLDVGRQRVIVQFLTTAHWDEYKVIGAAGVRAGIANGTLEKRLLGADGLLLDPLDTITAVLVVRNLHVELVQKARRLASASANLELLGDAWFVKNLKKILWPEDATATATATATDSELDVSLRDNNK